MRERESSSDIDRTAARWAARLDRGPLSPEERIALDRWVLADIRRQGALARAMAVSARFDELNALQEPQPAPGGTRKPLR